MVAIDFIYLDIGACGRQSDGNIFQNCTLGQALRNQTLNLSPPTKSPRSEGRLPFVFVGDKAYSLMKNLMRPFPGQGLDLEKKIYNYRLSCARRIVENAFGILSAKWRVLRSPIALAPSRADQLV